MKKKEKLKKKKNLEPIEIAIQFGLHLNVR